MAIKELFKKFRKKEKEPETNDILDKFKKQEKMLDDLMEKAFTFAEKGIAS